MIGNIDKKVNLVLKNILILVSRFKLFGIVDDKKILFVVVEWFKNKKYLDENKEFKENVNLMFFVGFVGF